MNAQDKTLNDLAHHVRLLIVEDSEDDTELLVQRLRKANFEVEFERVDNAAALTSALSSQQWDLVVADHNLPQFDSIAALNIVREFDADMPVIIVSGSIGEEVAVKAMQAGAQDYVLKDKLTRLIPAIERSLKEADIRRAHRSAEREIHFLAYHDPFTKLPNRHRFSELVQNALRDTRNSGRVHGLLYLDLDQFRLINDVCGHAAGDEFILILAERLASLIGEKDELTRLAGDAFGIVVHDQSIDEVRGFADQIRSAIKDIRFVWEDRQFRISASIGVVQINGSRSSAAELISAADVACYVAKDNGRDRVVVSTSTGTAPSVHHQEMEWTTRIREALDNNTFCMFSQRIVSLDPSRSDCREYLLRLPDPDEGYIGPTVFLPAAERYGLMPQIDCWVIERCLEHMQAAGDPKSSMRFVNISSTSLMDDAFCQFVYDKLGSVSYAPLNLCFEITENAAIRRVEKVLEFIREIKALGCKFALDDFGSGMCSLAYLKTLPVDYLKIDGSFITNILNNPIDYSIVAALQRISQLADMITVAECVEGEETLNRLRDLGIDYAQGFLLGRPERV